MRFASANRPLDSVGFSRNQDLSIHRQTASGDWMVVLAFSGGGTRAATLSYGVLEELSKTRFQR